MATRPRPGPRPTPRPAPRPAPRTPAPRHASAPPPPQDSRARILAAATAEFALRGFAATTVDRIAAHARFNKAMIYYHFGSKQGLYRAVLRDIFTTMGDRLVRIADEPLPPDQKLDRFVAAFVTEGTARPELAPIVLREVAEGGRRLDEQTYALMLRIVRTVTGIVDEGRAAGHFADVDPILLYLTTVWPIMVYLATTPIRRAIARVARFDAHRLDPDRFIAHLQQINRRALAPVTAHRQSPTGVSS